MAISPAARLLADGEKFLVFCSEYTFSEVPKRSIKQTLATIYADMAKTRAKKESEVSAFAEAIKGATSVVFADLSALKVAASTDLRGKARKESVGVQTAKKTLLRLALTSAGISSDDASHLKGSVAMIYGMGDQVAPAKIVAAFQKEHESVTILGGLFDSQWMSPEQVMALAKLPSKQQLIAQVVGTIRGPLSGLVGVLQGNLRGLVYALNAIKDAKTS